MEKDKNFRSADVNKQELLDYYLADLPGHQADSVDWRSVAKFRISIFSRFANRSISACVSALFKYLIFLFISKLYSWPCRIKIAACGQDKSGERLPISIVKYS